LVRAGIYDPQGGRIECLRASSLNSGVPLVRTATLPIRFGQKNIGATSGTSQMFIGDFFVINEGNAEPNFKL
jgi:hypothetical protein